MFSIRYQYFKLLTLNGRFFRPRFVPVSLSLLLEHQLIYSTSKFIILVILQVTDLSVEQLQLILFLNFNSPAESSSPFDVYISANFVIDNN